MLIIRAKACLLEYTGFDQRCYEREYPTLGFQALSRSALRQELPRATNPDAAQRADGGATEERWRIPLVSLLKARNYTAGIHSLRVSIVAGNDPGLALLAANLFNGCESLGTPSLIQLGYSPQLLGVEHRSGVRSQTKAHVVGNSGTQSVTMMWLLTRDNSYPG